MADETKIITGSYKGVQLSIDSGSLNGGRKLAVKQFPNRDTQDAEDLGLIPRKYAVEVVITDKQQEDYFGYRNKLLAALESKGAGELIHPMYGRIDNVKVDTYSLNETMSSFGSTVISINFEVSNNTGIPQSSGSVITQLAASNEVIQSSIFDDITNNFNVTSSFTGNFNAAVGKVNNFITTVQEGTSFIGEIASNIDAFSAQIGQMSANVNSLVSNPLALATSVVGLLESTNGLFASADATFGVFTGFFGFGSDDVNAPLAGAGSSQASTTAILIERGKNDDLINSSMASSSLGYSYLNIVNIDFQTTREIDELAAELDLQYEAVQESESVQAVKDAVTDMRVLVLEALDEVRVDTSQIVTVRTNPTTARILAFNYYGNDDNGQKIAELNGISDVSFVEGSVEVLTS